MSLFDGISVVFVVFVVYYLMPSRLWAVATRDIEKRWDLPDGGCQQ